VVDVTTTSGMRVIRSAERDHWRNSWLDSWQSFPATGNFDLAANAFGVLLVHNDDVIAPGEGLDAHQHASVEIVTWVVEGALVHRDSEGNTGTIRPGVAQRMSAGERVVHSERNASSRLSDERLRVVQMWVAPDGAGGPSDYGQRDFTAQLDAGGLVTMVSGLPRDAGTGAIGIGNAHAALHAARLGTGDSVTVPSAPYLHLYVVRGAVDVAAGTGAGAGDAGGPGGAGGGSGGDTDGPVTVSEGDAVRASRIEGLTVHGTDSGDHRAEVLVWEMHAAVA